MGHECVGLSVKKQTGKGRVGGRRKSTGSQACTHSHVLIYFQDFKAYVASYLDTYRFRGFLFLNSEKCSKCSISASETAHSVGSPLKQTKLQGFAAVCVVLCSGIFQKGWVYACGGVSSACLRAVAKKLGSC